MVIGNLIILSLITGIVTGFVVVIYAILTKLFSFFLFLGNPVESIPNLPVWYVYLVPIFSILIVNFLILKNEKVKEYGVEEIAQAIVQNRINFTFGI